MPSNPLSAAPDLAAIEERSRALWETTGIYRFDPSGRSDIFSIDTPPPYVSAAHLHVGHAMSYAQAEFIVRYQRMRGRRVFYPMGFDDNGLPTERFVERKYGLDKQATTRTAFRRVCLEETQATAQVYERLWRALGLSVDWSLRYSTIDEHCRRTAQRSFVDVYRSGRIYRSDDPVFWDPELRTALAQADLETRERPSVLYDIEFRGPVDAPVVISTTRPELLPACVALYFHPDDDRYRPLIGATALTPLFDVAVPVRADRDVDPQFGTGLMMVCTFGDADDVRRWRNDRLETRAGIDEDGCLTAVAGPYAGLALADARRRIVADLDGAGALRGARQLRQRVAVSERSGAPVELIMRPQWFLRVLDLKEELLERSAQISWHPAWMRQRLVDWIEGLRYDWNLSRQRYYGVPFPLWLCQSCGSVVLAGDEQLPVDPLEDAPPVACCSTCGGELVGDPDVMDTWMTSSLTPQILGNWVGSPDRSAPVGLPLTLRVQAHEIIRTWLFYTLVKGHLHAGCVPWRDVMISGWGLNEQGRRISKRELDPTRAAGTYSRYDPHDVIAEHGADAVRHWAARAQLGQDVRYSERDVKAGRKVVLKLWNIARFCQPHLDRGPLTALAPEDRWLVGRVESETRVATAAFERYDYSGARQAADDLLWTLADDWLEITKDRIWNPERYSDAARRSAAVTMHFALCRLVALYAPFLPFVTEELYQCLFAVEEGFASVHVSPWPEPTREVEAVPEMDAVLAILRTVRSLRTSRGLPQSMELAELRVEVGDDGLRRCLEAMLPTLGAAARARVVTFGSAAVSTGMAGLAIDIVP